jgi:hypothetical protein
MAVLKATASGTTENTIAGILLLFISITSFSLGAMRNLFSCWPVVVG